MRHVLPFLRANSVCTRLTAVLATIALFGCSTTPAPRVATPPATTKTTTAHKPITHTNHRQQGNDITIFALGLIETGYRFGGKNPEAGLDCSGMISYVYQQAANITLTGSAASISKSGRAISKSALQPGDLVFFNTRNKPRSHVGIYIGNGRFVHAPNSRGKVRTESLETGWFASRFEEARTYLD